MAKEERIGLDGSPILDIPDVDNITLKAASDWAGVEPEINEALISETYEADVIVAGGGLAGVAATREAAELGAKVLLFEKCASVQARSGDFAVWDSKFSAKWGRDKPDKAAAVALLMKDMCYRVDQRILKTWIDNAGAAFDWYSEAIPELLVLNRTDEPVPDGTTCWVQPRRYPPPDSFDMSREYYPCFQTTVWVRPSHIPLHKANFELAEKTGNVKAFFNTSAVKLVRDESKGKITGLIAKTIDGNYIRAFASKGVVLSTGDYMNNANMINYFVPQMSGVKRFWTSYDANKKPSNTGDGQIMGVWAGAVMDEHPHAPMTHHMGGVMGTSDFLLLNRNGERFVNEDCPGQQLNSQIILQPGKVVWQLFDSDWRNQVPNVTANHGAVCLIPDEDASANGKVNPKLAQIDSYVSEPLIKKAVEDGKLKCADTIEQLISVLGLPEDNAIASIARYNSLCGLGNDADFGKDERRLFPLKKPPFYASEFHEAGMLVCMGGLKSDSKNRCYDADGNVIPGLYCAGNTQGSRIAVEYPTTVPGMSHSMALTLGRLAGRNAFNEA